MLQVSLPLLPKHLGAAPLLQRARESAFSSLKWKLGCSSSLWLVDTHSVQGGWCAQGVGLPIRIVTVSISWRSAHGRHSCCGVGGPNLTWEASVKGAAAVWIRSEENVIPGRGRVAPRCGESWKISTKLLRVSLELQHWTVHSVLGLGVGATLAILFQSQSQEYRAWGRSREGRGARNSWMILVNWERISKHLPARC